MKEDTKEYEAPLWHTFVQAFTLLWISRCRRLEAVNHVWKALYSGESLLDPNLTLYRAAGVEPNIWLLQ
jgi:hypothetical protein